MKISLRLNGRARELEVGPGEPLDDVLRRAGCLGVHRGCNREGACGACGVLLDGRLVNSCLLVAAQVDGREVETVDHFNRLRSLDAVQAAFVDAGVVQCGYCTPAMVLAVHELLARSPEPSEAEIRDALSGSFCRCTGYQQLFAAVTLAAERRRDPAYQPPAMAEFRPELRVIGKVLPKVDAPHLAQGGKAFVEDRYEPGTCHLKILGSPHAAAYITSIDTSAAEAMPGVVLVLTHLNTPDVYYGSAGQGFPEPSPYDRRMFGEKLRHVGDRVAAVVAESEAIAEAALQAIKVEYELLPPVLTIEQAKAQGAPVVHGGEIEYVVGAPSDLDPTPLDPRDGKVVYQFPIGAAPRANVAASVSGGIGDVAKGFAEAEVIVEREYQTSQVQCTPLEPHSVYTKLVEGRLVVHASTQVPWHLRRILARILGLAENQIRVIKEKTGGGGGGPPAPGGGGGGGGPR